MSLNSIYPDDNVIWFHSAFFCWSMTFSEFCGVKMVTPYWWRQRKMDQNSWYLYILWFYYSFFWCGSWISVWTVVWLLFQIYYTCTRKYLKSRQNRRYISFSMPKYSRTLMILWWSMIKLGHEKTEIAGDCRKWSKRCPPGKRLAFVQRLNCWPSRAITDEKCPIIC